MNVRLGNIDIGLWRYVALWSAVVVVFAAQRWVYDLMLAEPWPPLVYLRWSAIQWGVWACLAPFVFRLAARHPLTARPRCLAIARHVTLSVSVTLAALVAGALVSTLFEPSGFLQQFGYFVALHAATGLMTYWTLVAIREALHHRAEQARREVEANRLAAELARSRLIVLKTQLQPHFLFNTLHAIVTLLDEDTLSAEDMLLRLSELLRAFLEDYDGQEISLRRELELLDLYLGIQRTRFKDRLTTQVYVAPDALDAAVPSLLLQPIAENAIRHGIGRRVGSDCVEIDCRRDGDDLCIDVRNRNGTLEPDAENAGHGIGLANTRLRLAELYGDAAQIRLDLIFPHGVACRIRLPYRAMADDAPPEPVAA